ncbi:MAG TPA: hypothetical protein VF543_22230 [Pyrinomonadaceae bacterium]|jgi:hypothetical protein
MKRKGSNNYSKTFDEIAEAIKGAVACAERMYELDEQKRDNINDFEDHLRKILELQRIVDGAPEAQKLFDRIARLRELRNMMELGSLMLETKRAMDAVWKRLP